ncbi:hypothetical protein AB0F77_38545 [Streptomyces sp. NPDC026672]|uniref:hypothetical protein n=1 Tax=unclassified Streptomyces TaxID=2593676 RepID=UPI0033D37025
MAGVVAGVLYCLGLLALLLTVLDAEDGGTDSAPVRPCRSEGWRERAGGVVGYSVSFVPLAFECHTGDGGSYNSGAVPSWINPSVLGFGVTALGGGLAVRYGFGRPTPGQA